MRVVIACVIVILSVAAALGIAQTQNVFSSFGTRTEPVAAAKSPAAPPPVRVASNSPVQTVSPVSPVTPVNAAPAMPAPVQTAQPSSPAPAAAAPAPQMVAQAPAAPPPAAAAAPACPGNPNALGTSRTVEIDTTGGPGFGFEHFKQHDFLKPGEVVLTFDDGPWVHNTPAVLAALANHCVKAVFFPIGKHATYYPEILKQVAAAGHTVGAHTWSHANLNNKTLTEPQRKEEIEKGFSAVKWALGTSPSPFFRFPALQHPPEMVTYLGTRNIGIFSCDLDSFDFKASKPDTVIDTVMKKVEKLGKGIVLMHDFQKHTAEALPELLRRLKAGGYKVVAMRAKSPVQTLPQYDEELMKDIKLPTVSSRPVSSVVTTVSE